MESNHKDQSSDKDVEDFEVGSKTSGLTLSSGGRMLVKLKLPRLRKEDDDEEIKNTKVQQRTSHYCTVCNKSFKSGKALGGHMSSAHVQANKWYNSDNNSKKLLKSSYDEPTKFKKLRRRSCERKIRCSCCGKEFRSKKSLFGHMRTHPEREWRGMAPPTRVIKSDSYDFERNEMEADDHDQQLQQDDDDDDDDRIYSVVDLTRSLKGWSAKARRGGKGSKLDMASVLPSVVGPEDEELLDVCNQLISLGRDHVATGKSSVSGKRSNVDDVEAISSNSLTPDDKDDEEYNQDFQLKHQIEDENIHSAHSRNDKGKRKGNFDLSKEIRYGDSSDTESDCDVRELISRKNDERIKVKMLAKNKKRKKMRLIDSCSGDVNSITAPVARGSEVLGSGRDTASTPGKYKCSECDKSFTTYQALGGHRSSHNKFKICIHNTIDEIPSSVVRDSNRGPFSTQSEGTKDTKQSRNSKGVENTHQCTICKKNFPTGQALGGHMRGHKTGSAEMASSSQVTSSPEKEAIQSIHKILEFDLNELPNTED